MQWSGIKDSLVHRENVHKFALRLLGRYSKTTLVFVAVGNWHLHWLRRRQTFARAFSLRGAGKHIRWEAGMAFRKIFLMDIKHDICHLDPLTVGASEDASLPVCCTLSTVRLGR